MIVPCSTERKLVTLQLAREVSVRTVVLTSLEYFSSTIDKFVLLGAAEFPCAKPGCSWTVLGHFAANFSREPQTFHVDAGDGTLPPTIRYVRLLWVSHFGTEKSCTLSSFQIFGHDGFELGAIGIIGRATEEEDDAAPPAPSNEGATAHNMTAGHNETVTGAYVPTSPEWREPHQPGMPWNLSYCPATEAARDIEAYFARRELRERTCAARAVPQARHVHDQAWLTIQRQITGIRRNVSQLAANVSANTTSRSQHRELSRQVSKLRSDVAKLTQTVEALRADLDTAHRHFSVAVGTVAVVACLAIVLGFGTTVRPPPRTHQVSVDGTTVVSAAHDGESSDTDTMAGRSGITNVAGRLPGRQSMPELSEMLDGSADEAGQSTTSIPHGGAQSS
jgi:outer membrane murein-binding lipoprotein Lpp